MELDSKMSVSVRSVSTEDSTSTASDDSSMNRPVLRRRRDTSNKKATRNPSFTMSDNNKSVKSSSSTDRLKQFKKKLASSLVRKRDAYQKINTSNRKLDDSFRYSNGEETKRPPSRSNSVKSNTMFRHGVRRAVSCDDDVHTMSKAVSRIRGRDGDSDRDSLGERASTRHSINSPYARNDSFLPIQNALSSPNLQNRGRASARHSISSPYARNESFVPIPNALSSPNIQNRGRASARHSINSPYARNESFVPISNALSSPNFQNRGPPRTGRRVPTPNTSFSSKSSKASSKSTNDLLTRAGAIAGLKKSNQQNRQPYSSKRLSRSTSAALMQSELRPEAQKLASSSSPHLLATPGTLSKPKLRRQSDPAMDLAFFRKHLETIEAPIEEENMKQKERSFSSRDNSSKSEYTGISNNRRRSKRHFHNEIVMEPKQKQNTKNANKRRLQQTKDHESQLVNKFREDFPDDPIPSDAILLRLYSNIPPPPPYTNHEEEQVAAKKDVSIPLSATLEQSVISPEDLKKNGDATSCLTFDSSIEWKVWKDSVDKSRRNTKFKHSPSEDTTNDASRRSESSKSGKTSHSTRRSSQWEQQQTGASDRPRSRSGNRNDKSRLVPEAKGNASSIGRKIRSNEISSSMHELKSSKRKGTRREGMSLSAHGTIKSKRNGESTKAKHKNTTPSPKTPDAFSSTPEKTPSTRDLSYKSVGELAQGSTRSFSHNSSAGSHSFQNALLDLSNGSFYDSTNNDGSNHTTRDSLEFLRTSLTKLNSQRSLTSSRSPLARRGSHSFNDSGNFTSSGADSFAEKDDKTDKERRKKRRGKRRSSVGSERQSRSRSAEERIGTKARRGRRGSKSKPSNEESFRFDDSGSFDLEGSGPLLSREVSRTNSGDESGGKLRRSPKLVSKKVAENGTNRRKSPRAVSKKNPRDTSAGKQLKSPNPKLVRKNSTRHEAYPSPRSRSRKTSSTAPSLKNNRTEFDTSNSKIVNNEDLTPISGKLGKISPELDKKKEEDDFYDLALSSWVDRPKQATKPSSPRGKGSSARTPEPARRRESERKNTRWLPELSPAQTSGTNERVPHFSEETIPTTPSPKSEQQVDFPLNFVEYTDVSPLTVASKKVRAMDIDKEIRSPECYTGE